MNRRGEQEAVQAWVRTVLEPTPGPPPETPGGGTSAVLVSGSPATGATGAEAFRDVFRETWASLELPPAAVAPAGFSRRVARAWSHERESVAPILAAPWMRAAAAAALLAGVVVGSALSGAGESGAFTESGDSTDSADSSVPDTLADVSTETEAWADGSLSEEYLTALGDAETALVEGTGAGASAP